MLPHTARIRLVLLAALLAIAVAVPALAQAQPAPPPVTAADYARAEKFLAAGVMSLVVGGAVQAAWLPDDRFYYRNTTADGTEFVLVSPATKSRGPAFDHAKLAATLSAAAGSTYDPKKLPFAAITLSPDAKTVSFDLDKRRWTCDVQGLKCEPTGEATGAGMPGGGRGGRGGVVAGGRPGTPPSVPSPDGKRAVFIRDWNLWIRDVATSQEKQLTTDGVKDFGYATDNAGWATSDRPIVLWSPDSKKIATYQQDERKVGDMYLVETKVGHPDAARLEVPAAGRRGRRDAAAGHHRRGHRQDHPVRHAARLPSGDARRQLQHQRHAVEPGRREARVRLHLPRSQAGNLPRGGRRHGRRSHRLRRDGEDALRVALRLAGVVAGRTR